MADYTIKDLHQGGASSLSPNYGDTFTGYRMGPQGIGITTDARSANILKTLNESITKGLTTIEVGAISPEVFDSIPKQQLKEVNRLSKLTGVDITVHAPVVEPSGMDQQGHFTESNREATERQMKHFIETAHELSPHGHVPVTFHSSASLPWETPPKGKIQEDVLVIDSETNSMGKIPLKERFWPGEKGQANIENEINKLNDQRWKKQISDLSYHTNIARNSTSGYREFMQKAAEAEQKAGKPLVNAEKEAMASYKMGTGMLEDAYTQLKGLFELANKYSDESDKARLNQFALDITPQVEQIQKDGKNPNNAKLMAEIIDKGVDVFQGLKTAPQTIKRFNEFAKDKAIETFSNVALHSWKKFKDNAPIISIENPPAGGAFSTGEELRELVDRAKEGFVKKAVKEKLLSESEAKKQADRMIGVTWDVGHINMMRKHGYDDKDIIKETEKVASVVKHIHLSDNFGYEHTELPMGMGNVPIKEMLEKLPEKDVKKIVEAVSWYQHFQSPAASPTLEAFGSPFYASDQGPYWNQGLGYQQDYSQGMAGPWLPQINYETFGGSFTNLPIELGGQRQGAAGGRMSGRPME